MSVTSSKNSSRCYPSRRRDYDRLIPSGEGITKRSAVANSGMLLAQLVEDVYLGDSPAFVYDFRLSSSAFYNWLRGDRSDGLAGAANQLAEVLNLTVRELSSIYNPSTNEGLLIDELRDEEAYEGVKRKLTAYRNKRYPDQFSDGQLQLEFEPQETSKQDTVITLLKQIGRKVEGANTPREEAREFSDLGKLKETAETLEGEMKTLAAEVEKMNKVRENTYIDLYAEQTNMYNKVLEMDTAISNLLNKVSALERTSLYIINWAVDQPSGGDIIRNISEDNT